MSCIPWDGIALACRPNNMPFAPARIPPITTQQEYRQLPPAAAIAWALATTGIANSPRAIPTITNGPSGSSPSSTRKGLAYEAEMLVNYCPALGTVLANEEVENGTSKEGGYPVERRPLRQWVLKITAYADS